MNCSVSHVSKKLKGSLVLDDVSVTFPEGRVTGLMGVNGSGKTMLLRVIAGLMAPDSGTVLIDGKALFRDISFPPDVGVLIENPAFLDSYSGLDNLMLLAGIRGKIRKREVVAVLERVGLSDSINKKFQKYSLGMKQRLGIAAAVMERPDLILLDEPTNALDESGVAMLEGILRDERKRGATIVVASHDKLFVEETCDRIVRMGEGRVVGASQVGDRDA